MNMRLKPLSACLLLSTLAMPAHAKSATKYGVLLDFNGNNGSEVTSGMIADKSGNLFGVTQYGGADNAGTVFELAADGTYTLLYSFTGKDDGYQPDGPLSEDKNGNLYGTTFQGGSSDDGVVFKVAPGGTETVLHTFTGSTNDGALPHGGVTIGKKGILYGATQLGGANDYGTVFVLHPSGKFRLLHSFTKTDGEQPEAGVTLDKSGNIYGTTIWGGPGNTGVVYEVTPGGKESVIYAFQNGFDGGLPDSAVTLDKSGNLYGTTLDGGDYYDGVVFKVTPSGTETALYSFSGGSDGGLPYSPVILDKHGNIYGTTTQGGTDNFGVIFKLAADGAETVLHSFTGEADGGSPYAGLVTDPALGGGYMYGTTISTVFKIK